MFLSLTDLHNPLFVNRAMKSTTPKTTDKKTLHVLPKTKGNLYVRKKFLLVNSMSNQILRHFGQQSILF